MNYKVSGVALGFGLMIAAISMPYAVYSLPGMVVSGVSPDWLHVVLITLSLPLLVTAGWLGGRANPQRALFGGAVASAGATAIGSGVVLTLIVGFLSTRYGFEQAAAGVTFSEANPERALFFAGLTTRALIGTGVANLTLPVLGGAIGGLTSLILVRRSPDRGPVQVYRTTVPLLGLCIGLGVGIAGINALSEITFQLANSGAGWSWLLIILLVWPLALFWAWMARDADLLIRAGRLKMGLFWWALWLGAFPAGAGMFGFPSLLGTAILMGMALPAGLVGVIWSRWSHLQMAETPRPYSEILGATLTVPVVLPLCFGSLDMGLAPALGVVPLLSVFIGQHPFDAAALADGLDTAFQLKWSMMLAGLSVGLSYAISASFLWGMVKGATSVRK